MTAVARARNAGLYAAGLLMGSANTVRHRYRGYVTPRPFSASNVERTIAHTFEIVDRWETDGEIDWTDKHVLELGPGSDLATGAVVLARGAASYRAIDAFDNTGQADPRLYAALARQLGSPVDRERLAFTLASFPGLEEVPGRYDLIASNATLEHIAQIPALLLTLRRLAAPGARMVHHVDAKTHMRWITTVDPLNILRYPDRLYARLLDFPGAPNRLRADDYVAAAEAGGWNDVRVLPAEIADRIYLQQTRVAPRFRASSALDVLTFTLVADA